MEMFADFEIDAGGLEEVGFLFDGDADDVAGGREDGHKGDLVGEVFGEAVADARHFALGYDVFEAAGDEGV